MPRPQVTRIALGAALVAGACRDRAPEPGNASASSSALTSAPALPTGPVTVRDRDGAVVLALAVQGTTCTATGASTITVTRAGDATRVTGGPAIERSAAGDRLVQDAETRARVWRDPAHPGHVDVVGADGMALARYDANATSATVTDAAGAPIARVTYEGGRFVAKDARDAVLAYVSGGDADLAALLGAPLPFDVRAVAACDRLLPPVTVTP